MNIKNYLSALLLISGLSSAMAYAQQPLELKGVQLGDSVSRLHQKYHMAFCVPLPEPYKSCVYKPRSEDLEKDDQIATLASHVVDSWLFLAKDDKVGVITILAKCEALKDIKAGIQAKYGAPNGTVENNPVWRNEDQWLAANCVTTAQGQKAVIAIISDKFSNDYQKAALAALRNSAQ